MYQAPEQLIALNKANLETATRFAGVAMEGVERILDLQMKTAKTVFADSIDNANAMADVKDVQQFASLKDSVAQPSMEKAAAYAKSVYDVTAATQAEFGKLVEKQFSEFNKQVVAVLDKVVTNAPAGSEVGVAAFKSTIAAMNSSYENLSKVAKQFAEVAQSNIETAAKQTVNGAKKTAAKKAK